MKIFLKILLGIAAFLLASPVFASGWLIYHDGPYNGKVVDAETNEPIEDVAVVAVWYLERYGGAGGPVAKFFEAKETVTNSNGEFEIPAITGFHWWPFASLDKPDLILFKPGYISMKLYNFRIAEGNIKLTKARTRKARIESTSIPGLCVSLNGKSELCIPIKKISNTVIMLERERKELGLSQ